MSLTDFGKNNQDIKKIESELVSLSDKQKLYLIDTMNLNKNKTNENLYPSVQEKVKTNQTIWNSLIEKLFSKNDSNKNHIDN